MTESVRDEIAQLAADIRALERRLEATLAKRRIELNYRMLDGVAHFEQAVIARHRLLKRRLLSYIFGAKLAPPRSHPADQPAPGPEGRVPRNWRSLLHDA